MISDRHARGHRVLGAVLGLAVAYFALGVNAASAQEQARDLTAQSANVHRVSGGQGLTPPSGAAPATIVATFLRSVGHGQDTVSSLRLTGENPVARNGLTHLRFGQEVDGLQVYGTYVKAAVNSDGELVHLIENLAAPSGGTVPASAGPRDALDAALDQVHPDLSVDLFEGGSSGNTVTFGGDDFFYRDPTVTRVAIVMASGALREGYLVETWSDEDNLLHHTLVAGNGRVLGVQLRTNNDSYNIFTDNPDTTPQAEIDGPGAGNAESPDGWLFTSGQSDVDISGNNAHAYLDADANNAPDAGGSAVPDGIFDTPADLEEDPESAANKAVAVQNLFYLNNVIHDELYRHGFDEAAGNFQEVNFGPVGQDGDSVNAEAQDGSGTDNANFSTPADGSNPRMQMFLWNNLRVRAIVDGVEGDESFLAADAEFGLILDATGVSGFVVAAVDGVGTTSDGCETLTNGAALLGKIALIDRGGCTFVEKVNNAQAAGAVGVIIVNLDDSIVPMGGTDNSITIPSVMVGQSDGATIATIENAGTEATLNNVMKDGDLDSDIVRHEYGHGLTWRMIGNMNGAIAGAIGEGMGDVLAILANDNDVVGEYSFNNANGIRSEPYTNYSRTYGDMTGDSVHFDGEIYAATIWHLWGLFQDNGISQVTLLGYLVDGMNFTPSGPAMEDMRDGILAAANDLVHECLIWQAFAAFGIGEGAQGKVRGGGPFGGSLRSVTESFDLPAECSGTPPNASPDVAITAPTTDSSFGVGDSITFTGTADDAEDGNIALDLVWTSNLVVDAIGSGASFSTTALIEGAHTITATVTDSGGANGSATITITVGAPPAGPEVSACAPDNGNPGDRLTVTVTGSNFESGATVDFGSRIAVQNVAFVNSSKLAVGIKIHRRASGSRDVTVSNPDGNSATGLDCFTVN